MAQYILVVEDDRLNRELLSKVLRQEGYQVLEACDGDIALKILQVLPCDLVITDFLMPMLNGIEFVDQLRPASAANARNFHNRLFIRHFR